MSYAVSPFVTSLPIRSPENLFLACIPLKQRDFKNRKNFFFTIGHSYSRLISSAADGWQNQPEPNNMTATEPTNMKIKPATKSAIAKYGIRTCIEAHEMHEDGNGASTVSLSFSILKGNTNSGDAAINAGRDLKENGII